jgi:hypothetical protein
MIAYNADDAALYGVLYHYPATQNNTKDEVVEIYDWDTGVSVYDTGKGDSIQCNAISISIQYQYQ